jgi:membrane protein implicated in regulation of membrane protease activity
MPFWIIWLLAAALLGVGEMHQGGFYLAPFALGAAVAALLGILGVGAGLSAIAFVISSGIVFAALRPVARRHRQLPPSIRTGAAALVGKPAMVLERIANDEGVGCVRIEGGEVWTARSYDQDEVIDVGERVEVVEIRGATALVMH